MRLHDNGTNWKNGRMSRTVYVLVLVILMALFQGLCAADRAEAGITTLKAWSNVYSGTTRSIGPFLYAVPAPSGAAGNTRLLVVAVHSTLSAASTAQTCTASYGGQAMTPVAGNFATSARDHSILFYLPESGIVSAGSNTQLVINLSATGTQWLQQVQAAVFEGVNQSTIIQSSSNWLNDGTASATFGPLVSALSVSAGNLAVETAALTRYASATPRTILTPALNWNATFGPTTQANGTSASSNFYAMQFNIPSSNTTTTSTHTASNTTNGTMSAMTIIALPMNLWVGNGTTLGAANAGLDTANNVLDSFGMSASAGGVTVNSIVFRGNANFTTTNIAATNVYQDNGTPGVLDGSDVLLSTTPTAITANTTTLTFGTPLSLTTTTVNYLVTVDIAPGATVSSQVTGTVIGATGTVGTPVYSDTNGATLTIQNAPGLTVSDGAAVADGTAMTTSVDNALDGFALQTVNATGGTAAVDTLKVRGNANFTSANISDVHVYKDNGTLGTLDGADVLMPSSATPISGNTTTLTFNPPIYVTSTTPTNYLVTIDITAGATVGSTVTGTVIGATGHGLATPTFNDPNSAQLIIKGTSKITSCRSCHAYPPTDGPRLGTSGAVTGDHGKHDKPGYVCSICHVAPSSTNSTDYSHGTGTIQLQNPFSIVSGTYSLGSAFTQTNTKGTAGNPTGVCTNVGCHGGNSPTPTWGVGTNSNCVTCHNGLVSALVASAVTGGTVTRRDNVRSEFSLTWGHKKAGRSTVTTADCIVCHLEGNYTTQATSTVYHANGYIDLRDPDVQGETPITNISGQSYSFARFSTSYTAGSRSSNGHTFNTVDNILTQKFCLACHDSNGATNTTARSNNGGTGTAAMPFGGVALGANYIAANNAIGTQGLVDVKTQLTSTYSSWHPIIGPKNRDYPTAARLADPYKPLGTRGTAGTRTPSVVMNCFDCHNTATRRTDRTIVAHGNAVTIPGVLTVTGTAPAAGTNQVTFCIVCHIQYDTQTGTHHGTGSALSSNTNNGMSPFLYYGCNACHSSGYNTAIVRPIRAQDVHGNDVVRSINTPQTLSGRWLGSFGTPAQVNTRPYAFIRIRELLGDHTPRVIGGSTYTPGCDMVNATPDCSQGLQTFTGGGTY